MASRPWLVIVALALTAPASAAPLDGAALGAALARHAPADVAALRAQLPGDAAGRCVLGAIYARRGDRPRAAIYLAACDAAALPDDLAAATARTAREVTRALRDGRLVELEVITQPAGLTAVVDALPDERLTTPATVWVEAGRHEVRVLGSATPGGPEATLATTTVTPTPHTRAVAYVDVSVALVMPAAPRDGHVDLSEEAVGEAPAGPPPDVKHGTLLPDRYQRKAAGEELADVELPVTRAPITWHVGVRFGGGRYGADGAARAGWAAAAVVGRDLGAVGGEVRLDWSRRGGGDGVGALGTTVGVSRGLALGAVDLAVVAALRGEVRFDAMLGAAAVPRLGLGVVGAVELAPRGAPIVVGLRLEQGVTALVADTRDRAILVELGLALR
jgi:hypothetical protein